MIRSRFARFIATALLTLGLVATPRTAKADTSAALYDDFKDIVLQLIELRVANSAADFVERYSPMLRFYLSRTLDQVRRDQWIGIRDTMILDLSDLSADFAFWMVKHGQRLGNTIADTKAQAARTTLEDFSGCFDDPTAHPYCKEIGEALTAAARTSKRGAGPDRKPVVGRVCDSLAGTSAENEVACSVASVVRSLFNGDVNSGRDALRGFAVTMAANTGKWDDRRLVRRVLDEMTHRGKLSDLVPGLGDRPPATIAAILRQCGEDARTDDPPRELALTATMNDAAKTPEARALAFLCLSATSGTSRPVPQALLGLLGQSPTTHGSDLEAALSRYSTGMPATCNGTCPYRLIRVAAELQALFANIRVEGSGVAGNETPHAIISSGTLPVTDLAALAESTLKWLASHDDVSWGARTELKGVQKILEDEGATALDSVHELMHAVASQNHADLVGAILHIALDAAAPTRAASNSQTGLAGVLGNIPVSDLSRRVSQQAADETRLDSLYRNFVTSFIQYTLALRLHSDDQAATRDAFRVASLRLIDGLSSSQGFRRSGIGIYPVLSLRLAWSPGYAASTTGDGFRSVVSVDWPTVRTHFGGYVALQFSAIDFTAPAAELALRKPAAGGFGHQDLLVLDIIRPRVTLMVGLPQITKNVVVSASVAARLVGLCYQPASSLSPYSGASTPPCLPASSASPATDGAARVLNYRSAFTDRGVTDQIPEVSLALSYVF